MQDDKNRTLIAALLLRAGALMEDLSLAAVSTLPNDRSALRERTAAHAEGGRAIAALTGAADHLAKTSTGASLQE